MTRDWDNPRPPSHQLKGFLEQTHIKIEEIISETSANILKNIQENYPSNRRAHIRSKVMENVIISDCGYETPCWLWTGHTSGNDHGRNYARMNLDGGTVAVHIAMWTNENGLIPPKKQLDHRCRSRLCVRPDHLELVTHKENMRRRDEANGIVRKPKRRKISKK